MKRLETKLGNGDRDLNCQLSNPICYFVSVINPFWVSLQIGTLLRIRNLTWNLEYSTLCRVSFDTFFKSK